MESFLAISRKNEGRNLHNPQIPQNKNSFCNAVNLADSANTAIIWEAFAYCCQNYPIFSLAAITYRGGSHVA
jgi:hypothetical protein